MMTQVTFIDLQGFKTESNDFIVKEAAILRDGNKLLHWIFEPPFEFRRLTATEARQVRWLTNKHHGIGWTDGYVPYKTVGSCLKLALENTQQIIVRGLEKKKWLWKLTGIEALDLDQEDVPRLSLMPNGLHRCAFHTGVCAMENVFKLCKLYTDRQEPCFF